MSQVLVFVLKIYKIFISPLLVQFFGTACRFHPTCSEYSIEAIESKGVIKGSILSVKRILKCNAFFKPGYNPVS